MNVCNAWEFVYRLIFDRCFWSSSVRYKFDSTEMPVDLLENWSELPLNYWTRFHYFHRSNDLWGSYFNTSCPLSVCILIEPFEQSCFFRVYNQLGDCILSTREEFVRKQSSLRVYSWCARSVTNGNRVHWETLSLSLFDGMNTWNHVLASIDTYSDVSCAFGQ